ncbi:MAG: SDR family oxidoreductase [Pseudonocardiales bacterium]|nr:SDR family oxidoreductase [Pseudonocardiales bacterium]
MIHVGVETDLLDVEGLGVVNVGHGHEHQLKFPIHDRNVLMGSDNLGCHGRGLAPGSVGDLVERANVPDEVRHTVAAMTPLGRLGRPENIAAVVAYLAGPDASWLTGQNIRADGGLI